MAVEVKKGGRQEYTCAGCGKPIAKGEAHFRTGAKDFKRYHKACLPAKKPAPKPAETTKPTEKK